MSCEVYEATVKGKVDVLEETEHLEAQLTPNKNTVLHAQLGWHGKLRWRVRWVKKGQKKKTKKAFEKSQNHRLHGTTSERVLDRIDDGAYSRHGVDLDLMTPRPRERVKVILWRYTQVSSILSSNFLCEDTEPMSV
ncbi:hypothetical protein AAG906_025008 [Vitis piasezkii]